ncbi:hypothetical protein HDU93_000195 [Gonapodya sp. JEL0774]|nr:hypothetical protein HDU93_000195 [Gonapodya sp. JEL0774]
MTILSINLDSLVAILASAFAYAVSPLKWFLQPAILSAHVSKLFYTPIALVYLIFTPSRVTSAPSFSVIRLLVSLAASLFPLSYWGAKRGWIARIRWEIFESTVNDGIRMREAHSDWNWSAEDTTVKDTSSHSLLMQHQENKTRPVQTENDAQRLEMSKRHVRMDSDAQRKEQDDVSRAAYPEMRENPSSWLAAMDARMRRWAWGKVMRSPASQLHKKYLKQYRPPKSVFPINAMPPNTALHRIVHPPSPYLRFLDIATFPQPTPGEYRVFDCPESIASAIPVLNIIVEAAAAVAAATWFLEILDAAVAKR